jgi:hypothetical protein
LRLDIGCEPVQGFLWERPVPLAELRRMIRSGSREQWEPPESGTPIAVPRRPPIARRAGPIVVVPAAMLGAAVGLLGSSVAGAMGDGPSGTALVLVLIVCAAAGALLAGPKAERAAWWRRAPRARPRSGRAARYAGSERYS